MRVAVAGMGYVGLSNACLLAPQHEVVAVDIDPGRGGAINSRRSPTVDPDIQSVLASPKQQLEATTDWTAAYSGAEFVIVATPTDYDPTTNKFNTSSVKAVIRQVREVNRAATIVIKSTIPVGFTD